MGWSARCGAAARSLEAVHAGVAAALCGEPAAGHRSDRRAGRAPKRSGGRQGLVAELAQGVETALEEIAREREAGAVAAEALGGLVVVGAVGAAGTAGGLGGFEQRPTQRRRSLAREVSGGAALVGLVDGDVQPGIADGVAR